MGNDDDKSTASGDNQGKSPEFRADGMPVGRPFQPGQSGNPAGKPSTKPITDAINRICKGEVEIKVDGKKIKVSGVEALAQIALNQAMKGKLPWFDRVMERIEGKVADELKVQGLPGLTPDMLSKISDAKEGPE